MFNAPNCACCKATWLPTITRLAVLSYDRGPLAFPSINAASSVAFDPSLLIYELFPFELMCFIKSCSLVSLSSTCIVAHSCSSLLSILSQRRAVSVVMMSLCSFAQCCYYYNF